MKNRILKKIIALSIIAGISGMSILVGATYYRGSVSLSATQKSVYTSGYSGHHGKSQVRNNSGSARSVSAQLQSSTGNGWTTLSTVTASPGETSSTNEWGRHDTDYLFRTHVFVTNPPFFGDPACVATGHIYTD